MDLVDIWSPAGKSLLFAYDRQSIPQISHMHRSCSLGKNSVLPVVGVPGVQMLTRHVSHIRAFT